LIGLAEGRPERVVGFLDETWFSRLARPALHSWSEAGEPLRLIEQSVAKDDPDPKAISCYGLFVPEFEEVWLRFVDGRPVSGITTRFLSWCCQKLQAAGQGGLDFDLGQRFLAHLQRGQRVDRLSQPGS
jgi:hypothetical protein